MSSGCESFELLLLQHQSQLGVYAKSKECQPGVDPYSRLKYQLFLETKDRIVNRPVRDSNT